jgi:hypothetical protein
MSVKRTGPDEFSPDPNIIVKLVGWNNLRRSARLFRCVFVSIGGFVRIRQPEQGNIATYF